MSDSDLKSYCLEVARQARAASRQLTGLTGNRIDDWLRLSADRLVTESAAILAANQQDLELAGQLDLSSAQQDRLQLTDTRIEAIADGLRQIAGLDSPVGEIFESRLRPNGLLVNKIRVPLGVIFFIYESRPNVTADAAAIALKSRNAIILRGGKEAIRSSEAIVNILLEAARQQQLPEHAVQLVTTTDRAAVDHFIRLDEWIDLTIPRGGEALIRKVAGEATMPVMKHFAGNCHVFVDQHADLEQARQIVINSKCQRVGVCNAAESLLVHSAIANEFLPGVLEELHRHQIEILGDDQVCQLDPQAQPATEEDYRTEFLDTRISVACVPDVQAAIDHINRFGSGHTDAIVSRDLDAISRFSEQVDSSAVMINASTRFNDGGEFGLGAEIGISTDKFHARGPCGLKELTTYKYVCLGNGQIR